MSTPENGWEGSEPVPPSPPSEPPPTVPSLSERLAELEPADDAEPLFDVDPFDDAVYGDPYDEVHYEVPPYTPLPVGLTDDRPSLEPGPGTAYDDRALDDGAFAEVAAPVTDADPFGEQLDATANRVEETTTLYGDEPLMAPTLAYDPLLDPAGVPGVAATTVVAPTLTTPPVEDTAGRRRRRRLISLPVVALGLVTALTAAATVFLWLEVRERSQTEDARRAGLAASRDAARLLFSYDYRTLDKDFATGRALTTGTFRTDYEKTTTKVVSDVAKQYKAVVKANVVTAGVVRATPTTVVTIVYVNQVTTSTRVTGEKLDLSRVRITLRRIDGRWLVERVDAL